MENVLLMDFHQCIEKFDIPFFAENLLCKLLFGFAFLCMSNWNRRIMCLSSSLLVVPYRFFWSWVESRVFSFLRIFTYTDNGYRNRIKTTLKLRRKPQLQILHMLRLFLKHEDFIAFTDISFDFWLRFLS